MEKHTKKNLIFFAVALLIIAAAAAVVVSANRGSLSPYETVCKDGYKGTEEEWLAFLVGETVDYNFDESAYSIAKNNGYRKSLKKWTKTITGYGLEDETKPMYEIMCLKGYTGSLVDWLGAISSNSEDLGQNTEYVTSCKNGFSGTYIEWLVFLVRN